MREKFLLLGGSGRIGRMVLRAWRSGGERWMNTPAQYRYNQEGMRQTDLVWEVEKGLEPVRRWIEINGTITTFIVLSGVTPATGSQMDENVAIANFYLDAASTLGVPRVLLASSSAVYGAGEGKALSENDACRPLNAYGVSKVKMEQSAQVFRDSGTEVCCLRIGNVAGADALLLNAPKASLDSPLDIDCFADGHGPQRSYIGPASLANILGQLADYQGTLPFLLNIASPEPVYMEELAAAATLPWAPRMPTSNTPQRIVLNCERLTELVQLKAESGLAHALISEWRKCS